MKLKLPHWKCRVNVRELCRRWWHKLCPSRATWRLVAVVLLAIAMSFTVVPLLLDWSGAMSFSDDSRFTLSDFYSRTAYHSGPKTDHGNVVCVEMSSSEREDIAAVLLAIADTQTVSPSAICLDFYFSNSQNNSADSLLQAAMSKAGSRLVLPVSIDDAGRLQHLSYTDTLPCTAQASYGIINLPGNYFVEVMRSYRPYFPCEDGSLYPSFAAAAIELAGRESYYQTDKEVEVTYSFENMEVVRDVDVVEMAQSDPRRLRSIVDDKIVFVGGFDDLRDKYRTPVDELFAGVLVHAYAANTLLVGNSARRTPQWLNMLFAFVIGIAMAWLLTNGGRFGGARAAIVRLFICLTILLLLIIGSYVYVLFPDSPIILDFGLSVRMFALVMLATDMVGTAEWIYGRIKGRWIANRRKKSAKKSSLNNTKL